MRTTHIASILAFCAAAFTHASAVVDESLLIDSLAERSAWAAHRSHAKRRLPVEHGSDSALVERGEQHFPFPGFPGVPHASPLQACLNVQADLHVKLDAALKSTQHGVTQLHNCKTREDQSKWEKEVKKSYSVQADLVAKLKAKLGECGGVAHGVGASIDVSIIAQIEASIKAALAIEVSVKAILDINLSASLGVQADLRAKLDAQIKIVLELLVILKTHVSFDNKCKLEDAVEILVKLRLQLEAQTKTCGNHAHSIGIGANLSIHARASIVACLKLEAAVKAEIDAYHKVALGLALDVQLKARLALDAAVKVGLDLVVKLNAATDVAVKAKIHATLEAHLKVILKLHAELETRRQQCYDIAGTTHGIISASVRADAVASLKGSTTCQKQVAKALKA